MDWNRLRQQGLLTLAIVIGSALTVDILLPNLTLRQVVLLIALVALLIGWIP